MRGLADRAGDLHQRRGGLLELGGLLFDPPRQIRRGAVDFVAAGADRARAFHHLAHGGFHFRGSLVEVHAQALEVSAEKLGDAVRQVAIGEADERLGERAGDLFLVTQGLDAFFVEALAVAFGGFAVGGGPCLGFALFD